MFESLFELSAFESLPLGLSELTTVFAFESAVASPKASQDFGFEEEYMALESLPLF